MKQISNSTQGTQTNKEKIGYLALKIGYTRPKNERVNGGIFITQS